MLLKSTTRTTHVAEEMPNPGRGVPRVMTLTMLIGMVTAFMWTLAFMFSASDLEEVSLSYLPILTIYYQTLRSEAGAAFFAAWLLVICESFLLPPTSTGLT
jgi:choline transport protein